MSYTSLTYTGVSPTITNISYTPAPIVGEVRYDAVKDIMHTWDGVQWVTLYGHKETVQETIQESVDRIILQVEEDHPNIVAIKDALEEWKKASEKFQVVLALSSKNK